jgi:AAA+ superfamily predicted ATPase
VHREEDSLMQFRHLRAVDLEGSTEFPGLADWLNEFSPEQCALLLLAPAGTGKTAAVGNVARKAGKPVVMCNLMQVLEYPDSPHQLRNLLLACETQRDTVLYLDKLDEMIDTWNREHPEDASRMANMLKEWLDATRGRLRDEGSLVVCTGRDPARVPVELKDSFDRVLTA